ncbi:hypothetical protein GY45DRAFT_614889 [Cubamyces sp. BRFM 1775]|nr:hypothetical protein GY45DRAFT_614889 [Cubamyces sp. BRFM 1775]
MCAKAGSVQAPESGFRHDDRARLIHGSAGKLLSQPATCAAGTWTHTMKYEIDCKARSRGRRVDGERTEDRWVCNISILNMVADSALGRGHKIRHRKAHAVLPLRRVSGSCRRQTRGNWMTPRKPAASRLFGFLPSAPAGLVSGPALLCWSPRLSWGREALAG